MARTHALWTVLGSCALLGLVALFAYAPIFSVDAFWHLKLGQIIVERGTIPDQDLFSAVHPERPYVQFQWLWDVLAHAAERLAGLHGVRLFSLVTLCASFALLGLVSARAFASRGLAFAYVALALVLFEDRFQTRPSATGLGFAAALLPLWLGSRPRPLRSELGYVYLVSCMWSNIHGGEALLALLGTGALALGDMVAARVWPSQAAHAALRRSLSLAGAAGVGLLSSPTFLRGLADWSWAIQPQLATGNKEWLPTYTMLDNGITPSFVLIALGPSALLVAYVWEQVRLARQAAGGARPLGEWLLCGGMFALSEQAVRNAFLCLVPLAFMLRRLSPRMTAPRAPGLAAGMGVCMLVIAFDDHVLQGYGGLREARALIHEDVAPATFPRELAAFAREAGIAGGIFNDGRWGGYLIWALWPQNHVFVDSRHDLTQAMWPLFLAGQSAGSRPAAMEEAFRRWGIGLTAFRGPTFPAVRAPVSWQLLYKAGEQELYQRVDAANGAANIARARALLAPLARDANAPLAELAIEVGARRWLDAPYQRLRAQRAEALLASSQPEVAAEGLALEAGLWFEAGLYRSALGALETALQQRPHDVRALYQAALAALALEDQVRAGRWLKQLAAHQGQLSPQQRNRLRAIDATDFF